MRAYTQQQHITKFSLLRVALGVFYPQRKYTIIKPKISERNSFLL